MCRASGVDSAMGGLVVPRSGRFAFDALHNMHTTIFHGVVVRSGQGVGGVALRDRRPRVSPQYLTDQSVTDHFKAKAAREAVRGAIGIPILGGGQLFGVVNALTRSDRPLGDRVIESATAVLDQLGVVLYRAQQLRHRTSVAAAAVASGSADLHEIAEELTAIAELTVNQDVRRRLVRLAARLRPEPRNDVRLSAREQEVLGRLVLGRSTPQIAAELRIAPTTAKSYVKNVMSKLGTRNRVETVNVAVRSGLVADRLPSTWLFRSQSTHEGCDPFEENTTGRAPFC
jgi:DNA-binding CsgD family transcriptional regulator